MARLFISYKREEQNYAFAVRQWLIDVQGWRAEDIFVDFDHVHAGDMWERKTLAEAETAEAMLFLASDLSLDIRSFCYRELQHAKSYILTVTIKGVAIDDKRLQRAIPNRAKSRQIAALDKEPTKPFPFVSPIDNTNGSAQLNAVEVENIGRILRDLGIAPGSFIWKPTDAGPYPGLRALMEEDAALLFGRDIEIRDALKALEVLRDSITARALMIQAPSGAGKSSLLRAGLWPRLRRHGGFTPLGIVRAAKGVVSNPDWGLISSLHDPRTNHLNLARAEIEARVHADIASLLAEIADRDRGEHSRRRRTLLLGLDQAEEMTALSPAENAEIDGLLARLLALPGGVDLRLVLAARDDSVDATLDRLARAGLPHDQVITWRLHRLPATRFRDIIAGPASVAQQAGWPLLLDCALIDALTAAAGGATSEIGDALPILALALQRMVEKKRQPKDGRIILTPEEARDFIETAVEEAAQEAMANAGAAYEDLRRLVIPRLATWDPKAGSDGAARRKVASAAELFAGSRAGLGKLADALVAQRLLTRSGAADQGRDGAAYEIAHEALLRAPPLGPLIYEGRERFEQALILEIEARDWHAAGRPEGRLGRGGDRLREAQALLEDADFGSDLARKETRVSDYLAACVAHDRKAQARRRRLQASASINFLIAGTVIGLLAWMNTGYIKDQVRWYWTERPYMRAQVKPYLLAPEVERALKPMDTFRECAKDCPEMIVVEAGEFMMGSPPGEEDRENDEGPQHKVAIARPFAVAKFVVTFNDWDACVAFGDCPKAADSGGRRGRQPVINVSWDDAQRYVAWLKRLTGKPYRLLSEAEWEYAARAGTTAAYYWGDEIGTGNANCDGCGSQWDAKRAASVGSFNPNNFGLYDMAGNVWQWVEDCYQDAYDDAPSDGSAWTNVNCSERILRGGSWNAKPSMLRAAFRDQLNHDVRDDVTSFRIGRTLLPRAP